MEPRKSGLFAPKADLVKEIEASYQDLVGKPTLIEAVITSVDIRIESAKQGGCIRRPSIMGPNPDLEHRYRLEKEVLEKMLTEAKKSEHSSKLKN